MFPSRRIATSGGDVYQNYYSLQFDGSNDYVDTGATFQTTLDGAFTVTAWIKPDDGQPSATGIICGSSSTSDEDRFYFMLHSSGKLGVLYKSNAGAGEMDDLSTSAVFSDGATDWTHVALTLTESGGTVTGTVYVNGVVEPGSFSGSGVMANFVTTYNLFIGAANRNTSGAVSPFAGNIDEVAIWNTALSSNQAKTLYNNREPFNAKNIALSNLKAYYRMGDGHLDTFP